MTSKIIFNFDDGTADRLFLNGATRKNIGTLDSGGYVQLWMTGKRVMLHRAMWEQVNGVIPIDKEIDHINGNRQDNRLVNLRLVTRKQNQENWNRAPITNVTSGVKGVSFYKSSNKWRAQIKHHNHNHHLGYFDSVEDARSAYCAAAAQFHTHNPAAKRKPQDRANPGATL
jgi:hypothetical protein